MHVQRVPALLQDANYTTLTVTRCTITTTLSHRGPERAREADNLPGNTTEVLQKYFCCKQVFCFFLWLFGEMIVSDCNHTNHCRDGCVLHANHNPNVHSNESAGSLLSQSQPALFFCSRSGRNLSKGLHLRTECSFKLTYCCLSCAERAWNLILAPQSDSASPRWKDWGQVWNASLSLYTLLPFSISFYDLYDLLNAYFTCTSAD